MSTDVGGSKSASSKASPPKIESAKPAAEAPKTETETKAEAEAPKDSFEPAKEKPPVDLSGGQKNQDGRPVIREGEEKPSASKDGADPLKPNPTNERTKEAPPEESAKDLEGGKDRLRHSGTEGQKVVDEVERYQKEKGLKVRTGGNPVNSDGEYDKETNTISISPEKAKDSGQYALILAHELTHAEQHWGTDPKKYGTYGSIEDFPKTGNLDKDAKAWARHAMEMEARAEARALEATRFSDPFIHPPSTYFPYQFGRDAAEDSTNLDAKFEAGVKALTDAIVQGKVWKGYAKETEDEYKKKRGAEYRRH
jgi:hypothetical protein